MAVDLHDAGNAEQANHHHDSRHQTEAADEFDAQLNVFHDPASWSYRQFGQGKKPNEIGNSFSYQFNLWRRVCKQIRIFFFLTSISWRRY